MDGRSRDQQESFELHEIATREDNDPDPSPSISTDEYRVEARRTPTITRAERDGNGNQNQKPGLWRRTKKSWTHSVALCVPQKSNRDHFALERTFLGYVRTSVMLSMQGATIAQLFRLQRRSAHSSSRLGFYSIGVPLACVYYAVALLVTLLGACRFWRQQNAIASGKVYSGGWEINCIGILASLVVLVTFALTVAVIAEIDIHGE